MKNEIYVYTFNKKRKGINKRRNREKKTTKNTVLSGFYNSHENRRIKEIKRRRSSNVEIQSVNVFVSCTNNIKLKRFAETFTLSLVDFALAIHSNSIIRPYTNIHTHITCMYIYLFANPCTEKRRRYHATRTWRGAARRVHADLWATFNCLTNEFRAAQSRRCRRFHERTGER